MKLCYSISFSNYIVALFFFALIMELILFPLSIKQQKSSVLLSKIKPKENAIRSKYRGRNDRATQQKMNMEIQEMYKQEGYSATAGCLPLLVQLPLIFILFAIVQKPLTYTTDLNSSSVGDKVVVVAGTDGNADTYRAYTVYDFRQAAYSIIDNQAAVYGGLLNELVEEKGLSFGSYKELETFISNKDNTKKEGFTEAKKLAEDAKYKEIKAKIDSLTAAKKNIRNENNSYRQMHLIEFMQKGVDDFRDYFTVDGKFTLEEKSVEDSMLSADKAPLADLDGGFMSAFIAKTDAVNTVKGETVYDFNAMLATKKIGTPAADGGFVNYAYELPNFTFIGNTTALQTPTYTQFNWLLLIPLLVFITSFFAGEVTRKLTVQPSTPDGAPNPSNSGMMRWGMPLISTFFSFSFPAAIGIYWAFRSVIGIGKQFLVHKMYPPIKLSTEELKEATKEVKQAKKRKKLVTIEVDEDDTSYDDIAISEERAEKLRRRREKQLRDAENAEQSAENEKIDRPVLKDDRKDKE